jgi:RNA polymerase sigma-54 factor
MALESKLELKLSQKLILTPQLQLAIKLLQMPQLELSQAISQELVNNPFLEEIIEERGEEMSREEIENAEVIPASDDTEASLERLITRLNSFSVEDYFDERGSDGRDLGYFNPGLVEQPSFEQFTSVKGDISDHLLWQLRLSNVPDHLREICELVIGNIDENGYLRITDDELVALTGAKHDDVRKAIEIVQTFDPPGIGARNLQECLLLQLRAFNLQGTVIEKIVLNNIKDIEKKRYSQIGKQYDLPMEDLMAAIKIIEELDPKPGRNYSSASPNYIVPDVYVMKVDDKYQIILNDEGMPRVRLNNYYKRLFQAKNSLSKEERQFVEERLRSAVWLLKSLDQRNKTIYRVTESILKFQFDFFEKGTQYLKPLNLKDVADDLGMHESTISRVTSNKYLSCSHGIFGFRFFFGSAVQTSEGTVSSRSVKDIIKKIVSEEDPKNPLSDKRIVEILRSMDIVLARRTVAKYREELRIPPHNQRKRLQ